MALIYPNDREDEQVLARALLDAAGEERHAEVQTRTDGPLGLAFEVPDDLAEQVLGGGSIRVVQPSLPPAEANAQSAVETKAEPEATEPKGEPAEAGEKSTSAVAGADVPEVDAEPADGPSQRSVKASRLSRASRSGAGR
ncbi:hypothetical protein [Micromonospora sp. KC721]|uniref:hypothetical protein n=1 Tax=Micromonospora sp. KC721 TaxID=2530380 RepID=UPI0010540312|nr:hypothetical protein [Micromonospora sp. KC721]TDB80936.1 hypothetical protein E1182_06975 [Micromonospora sp. KC721]